MQIHWGNHPPWEIGENINSLVAFWSENYIFFVSQKCSRGTTTHAVKIWLASCHTYFRGQFWAFSCLYQVGADFSRIFSTYTILIRTWIVVTKFLHRIMSQTPAGVRIENPEKNRICKKILSKKSDIAKITIYEENAQNKNIFFFIYERKRIRTSKKRMFGKSGYTTMTGNFG